MIGVDDLPVADFVVLPAEGMEAKGAAMDAEFGRFGHLDFADQVAGRRVRSRELDAGGLADKTPSAIAPDEIFRLQRPAIGEFDIDAGLVLRKPRHLDAIGDVHAQFADPAGQNSLDVVLPQPETVRVAGGKGADVEMDPGKPGDLRLLPLRKEAIGDAALVENLDGARVQTAGARPREVLAGAPLENGDIDARQRQLGRQHQPARASAGDHNRMLGHRHTPIGTGGTPTRASSSAKSGGAHTRTSAPSARDCTASPTIGSTSPRHPYVDNNTRIS